MPRFPFVNMAARARKAPMGPITFNQLKGNIEAVQQLASFEHAIDGRHNALEIPAILGKSLWGGGVYTEYLYSEGDAFVGTSNPAVGQVDLVVDSAMVPDPYRLVVPSCCDEDVLNKPWVAVTEWTASDTLSIYLLKLSSALGAGNTWAAADGSVTLLVHAPPAPSLLALSTITDKQRRDFLTEELTDWNAILDAQADQRVLALEEHTSAGEHDAPRVCREYGYVTYDSGGVKYDLISGDVASVSRVSQGVCDITTSMTFSSVTTMAAFPEVLGDNSLDLWIINYRVTATTTIRVYLYKYDSSADTWSRQDGDFFIAVWGT